MTGRIPNDPQPSAETNASGTQRAKDNFWSNAVAHARRRTGIPARIVPSARPQTPNGRKLAAAA